MNPGMFAKKVLLVAVNAKYIHTCPAVYSLQAFALANGDFAVDVAEYTINDRYQDVLADIVSREPDVIGFSSYIWNVDRVRRLIRDTRAVMGEDVLLWVGGPEATYNPEPFLREDKADLCMIGEGEEVFLQLLISLREGSYALERSQIRGLAFLDRTAFNSNTSGEKVCRRNTYSENVFSRSTSDVNVSDKSPSDEITFSENTASGVVFSRSTSDVNVSDKTTPYEITSDEMRRSTVIAATASCAPLVHTGMAPLVHAGMAPLTHTGMAPLVHTGMAPPVPMDRLPFLYRDLSAFQNRILYYEASRGCPFSCAYCLSGKEQGIRCRDIDTVRQELAFFLDHRVPQVKFIDRTFNAKEDFALEILTFIRDHDNGVTNFHFEIEADRMTDRLIGLVKAFRPGLIQMEIGVQSANPETLRSVHRSPQLDAVKKVMQALTPAQNINLHLDLIAGLPFEGFDSFRHSFNTVYAMNPHQLQLGFLKLLKGTLLSDRAKEYGLVCSGDAPYEVLKTKWLSFGELKLLHQISDRVEEYVNTQGFRRSLPYAIRLFPDAFSMFEALAAYYREHGYDVQKPSVQKRYEIFSDFIRQRIGARQDISDAFRQKLQELIRFDMALHTHPARRMILEDTFDFGEGSVKILFDHRSASPVNGEAKYGNSHPCML